MNRRMNSFITAAMVLSCAAASNAARAQSPADVVGTWTFVSSINEKDGVKTDTYGAGAKGVMTLDAGGRYSITIVGANLPKFASGNRAKGTPEENAAVVGKSNAHFGTYSIDPADKTISFRTERGTFPNTDGVEQKRKLTVSGDELQYAVPALSTGGTSVVSWQRAK